MLNKSIAYKLSIYISIAVIGVFLAFIVVAFYFNSGLIKSNIENKATALGLQAMSLGEKQLVTTREITSNISEQVMFFAQKDDVNLLVYKLMDKYRFLNSISIAIDSAVPNIPYRNYSYVRSNDSIYMDKQNEVIFGCNIEKGIFDKISETKAPGWTETFKCARNNNYVVAYYSPIQVKNNNNETVTIGSVFTELSLSDLNDTINSLKIDKSGYAFLVSSEGTYLTHPDKNLVLKKNIFSLDKKEFESSTEVIEELSESELTGTVIAYPEYLNYKKSWVHYDPIRETGWLLFFVVPYDELFFPLYLLVLRMLFFSVLGILVIFFIITYITNKLIQPLSTITNQLKKFSSFSGDHDLNTRNEIKLVSDSLDFLKSWYEKFEIEHRQDEILNSQRTNDLLEASEIQMSLINTDFSTFANRNNIDLYAIYKPARIVSGDLFDFIFLDDDNLFFTIGDVSGKGLSAAFFMSVAQTLLKKNSKLETPKRIVYNTNNELYTVNQHQFFLTLFCGVLNLKTGTLNYCNAAHTPILVVNDKQEITELGQSHGMPLGLYPNKMYGESTVKINRGDSIILYSDGVTEQLDNNKINFGNKRLYSVVQDSSKLDVRMIAGEIDKSLDLFKGDTKQTDDITLMVLQFKSKKKGPKNEP